MKFRLNMVSKRSGMEGYYERIFTQFGWDQNKLFDLPKECLVKDIVSLTDTSGQLFSVYTADLIPVVLKPLSEFS